MLFNSFEFIFLFLPVVLAIFFFLGRYTRRQYAIGFLSMASAAFYAWWNPVYIWLILVEVVFSFLIGRQLERHDVSDRYRRTLLQTSIGIILIVLGYFKYTVFLLDTLNSVAGTEWSVGLIVLPLGISFHSFQQIAYLVDAFRRRSKRYAFLDYCLFVTFFPQLIAGPIVHHYEAIPQIQRPTLITFRSINVIVGISIFGVGLFKKTIIADSLAQIASPVFNATAMGAEPTLAEAWLAAVAYSLQLYFDFSAYSDMATGLARMFNIRLPANFYSPYKARNIADFWRRWHMTLSRFLRDYLYIPLGGNRRGPGRQAINLMITMLLGGLWHGAGWTFVVWGVLHGSFLIIHRMWSTTGLGMPKAAAHVLTMLTIVIAWVYFRAADLDSAHAMLASMGGINGLSLKTPHISGLLADGIPILVSACLIAFFAPNLIEVFSRYAPALKLVSIAKRRLNSFERKLRWRPRMAWAVYCGILTAAGTVAILGWKSEFLYFQF